MFQSEKALLEAFIEATQTLDPDIILGFEVQKGSLGYLADRAATLDLPLLKLVSRAPEVGCLSSLNLVNAEVSCHQCNACFGFCNMKSPSSPHEFLPLHNILLDLTYSTQVCGGDACLGHDATLCLCKSCHALGVKNGLHTAGCCRADPICGHLMMRSRAVFEACLPLCIPLRAHALPTGKHGDGE